MLTARFVELIKPAERRIEYSDGRGLYLVVGTSGAKFWVLRYRDPQTNRHTKLTLGKHSRTPTRTLSEARHVARAALDRVQDGANPHTEKMATRTDAKRKALIKTDDRFAALVERYLSLHVRPRLRHADEVEGQFTRHIMPHFRNCDIAKIKRTHLFELLDNLATTPGVGPTVPNKVLANFRAFASWCVQRDLMAEYR
jgi:Arm DNA-binding domain